MISVTILTKNSERTLAKTLRSLSAFPEVILLDTGSTDTTLSIASAFPNVKIHTAAFEGFGPSHNRATSLASFDWILSIDSDEILSPFLSKEILSLPLDPKKVYQINRHNYFNGKWIRSCAGWHPDWIIRLYNRSHTRFSDDAVHEKVLSDGLAVQKLTSPLFHTPYLTLSDFLSKMQSYTTLYAEQHRGQKRSSLPIAIVHSWSAFFRSYILKRGFLSGKEGFIISTYNAQTALYKYLKLAEANLSVDVQSDHPTGKFGCISSGEHDPSPCD